MLVVGCWWLLTERTRGAEVATVLALPVTVVTLVVAVLPKGGPGPQTEDLEPRFRDLVKFVDRLFSTLGMSPPDFAKRHGFHVSTVYEILKGMRLPPLSFLEALINDITNISEAGGQRSLASVEDLRRQIFELRAKAVQERRALEAEVERLQQELSEAEAEAEHATRRVKELSAALRGKEAEREELMTQVRELERQMLEPLSGHKMIEAQQSKRKAESRRDQVDDQLAELRSELEREKRARMKAEELSVELQDALARANSRLVGAGGSPVELHLTGRGSLFFGPLRNGEVRGGGSVGAVGVVSIIYFGPFYLGLIYGSPGTPVLLRLSTLYGLALVVWFAYVAAEITPMVSGFRRARFFGVVAVMAALFLLGAVI